MGGFKLMASVSDVRYAQLQYEENRAFGEGLRKQQEGLDQKRGRMGLGRTLLSFAGGAIGTAGGPVGMAIGAGLGSALGSFLGGASTGKIDEIEKGKLYKATADEARRQGRDAQVYMKKMAVRGALSDAASAFFFAGTDIGKAAQVGSAEKLSGLGADANLLQKAWASGSGAVGGGAGHIKASIAEMQNEAFEGTFAGDLEGTLADTATVDPMMAKPTDPTGIRAWNPDATYSDLIGELPSELSGDLAAFGSSSAVNLTTGLTDLGELPPSALENPTWSSPSQAIENYGAGWRPGQDPGIGRRLGDVAGNDVLTKGTWQVGQDPGGRLGGIAQSNVAGKTLPQQLSPLTDAMQSQDWMNPGNIYGTPPQDWNSSWNYPGFQDALAEFRASRDQYGRAITGGG